MEPPLEAEDPDCTFGQCFCRWLRFCSPQIPHVGPSRDYERVPPDDRAAWSLLVGFVSPSAGDNCQLRLRLRRFRVGRCGRILGRSDDLLEILDDLDFGAKKHYARICASAATPGPDSSSLSLCLFVRELELPYASKIDPPFPVELHLDLNTSRITRSLLPGLVQDPLVTTRPISAADNLWAPFFTQRSPPRLMMRLLDKESKEWVEVGEAFEHETLNCAIPGYAVVGNTILLSMHPPHFFLTFDCSTHVWTVVATTIGNQETGYVPICDHGLYVEEDNTIYFLRDSTVYAYNLCIDQDQHRYSMAPPTVVNHVFPFRNEGYGFLTYLGYRIMCSVWIGVPSRYGEFRCNCDALHMLITTFRVMGGNESNCEPVVRKGVHVLHSTCRRLDISPSMPSDCRFYFLREYKEFCHNEDAMPPAKKKRENEMEPSMLEFTEARSNLLGSSKLLTCCRNYLDKPPFVGAVMLECSGIQIKKALYIICQDRSSCSVYEVSILDGRLSCQNKTLTKRCVIGSFVCDDAHDLMEHPPPWHFVCDSTSIYAFPYGKDEMYSCCIDTGTVELFHAGKPSADEHVSIALVLRVGHKIVAISDLLDRVYYLHGGEWNYLMTCQPVDSGRKIEISGYVVLNDESFMVSDAKSCYCYLFSLDKGTRRIVRPYAEFSSSPTSYWSVKGFLSGRSVFAEGFIYTCAFGGLAAYEIFEAEHSCCIGPQIHLNIPWRKEWKRESMCLDYLGKDVKSGAVIFCVVQGDNYYPRPGALHKQPVWITTIQVKTKKMPNGKLEPVVIGHLDISTSFTEHDVGPIWTTNCFVDV